MPFDEIKKLKERIENEEMPTLRKNITALEEEEGPKTEKTIKDPNVPPSLTVLVKKLLSALKIEKESIELHLNLWLVELISKTEEVRIKRKKALDDNQARRAGLLDYVIMNEGQLQKEKEDEEQKIINYFGKISAEIESCNIRYNQTNVLTSAFKTFTSVDIPTWNESAAEREGALKNFTDQIGYIKRRDILLPMLTNLNFGFSSNDH